MRRILGVASFECRGEIGIYLLIASSSSSSSSRNI